MIPHSSCAVRGFRSSIAVHVAQDRFVVRGTSTKSNLRGGNRRKSIDTCTFMVYLSPHQTRSRRDPLNIVHIVFQSRTTTSNSFSSLTLVHNHFPIQPHQHHHPSHHVLRFLLALHSPHQPFSHQLQHPPSSLHQSLVPALALARVKVSQALP